MKAIKPCSAPLLIIILLVTGAKCQYILCLEMEEKYSVDLEKKHTPLFKRIKSDLERKLEQNGCEVHFNPKFFENHDGKALAEMKITVPQRDKLVRIEEDLKKEALNVLVFNGKCEDFCPWSEWTPCDWVDNPGELCQCRYKQCFQQKGIQEQEVKNCTGNTSTTHKTEKSLTTPPTSTEKSLTAPPTSNCDQVKSNNSSPDNTTVPSTDSRLGPKENLIWIVCISVLVAVAVMVVVVVVCCKRRKRGSSTEEIDPSSQNWLQLVAMENGESNSPEDETL